jgi:DNA repair protein RecO (recombination protein O)
VQLTKYLGFFPENNYSLQTGHFDLRNGQFTGSEHIHPDIINREVSLYIHHLLKRSFSNLQTLKINQAIKTQLTNSLLDYYRFHIQDFGKMKSLAVLKEVYG